MNTVPLLPDTHYGYTVENKVSIPQDTLQDIVKQGFTWVRAQTNIALMWADSTSPVDWTLMDDIVLRCNALGLRVCLPFQNPATFMCSQVLSPANKKPILIPDVTQTVAFMTAMVTRYNGRTINPNTGNPYGTIGAIMLNEDADSYAAGWPGNGNPGYIGRDSTPIAPIFEQIYPLVKAQLPDCLVGCASLLGKRTDAAHIQTWVGSLFTAWGKGRCYIDFLDLHYYTDRSASASNSQTGDPPLAERLAAIRAACSNAGFPDLDIWLGEIGWQQGTVPPDLYDVTPQEQADNLVEAMHIADSYNVSHRLIWTIGSLGSDSIVQGHGTQKVYLPAYAALQVLAQQKKESTPMRGLFIGNESFTWKPADFTVAAERVKPFGIDTLFVKVADGTNLWYGGYAGIAAVLGAVTEGGLAAVPYTFSYGSSLGGYAGEVAIVNQLQDSGYTVCMDMESAWNGKTGDATNLAHDLHKPIYISTWADPHVQQWDALVPLLSPKCIAFLPQDYTAFLDSVYASEFASDHVTISQLIPTYNAVTILDALTAPSFVLWEYGSLADAVLQQFINAITPPTGGTMPLVLNAAGCVLDIVKSFQLENGETQDACGPWSVSSLRIAGLPSKGARGTAEDADSWADTEMNKYMPQGQVNWPGTSIAQMYQFIADSLDPVSKQRNLHWWDMAVIDASHIRAALKAGYPVLITANEQNIIEKKTGLRAYPWNLNASHVLPIVGVDKDGDFICADELNNAFQGYWPPVYLASKINPSWATMIQVVGPDPLHPWLAPIPGPDPMKWTPGFNAQLFAAIAPAPPVVPQVAPQISDWQRMAFTIEWTSEIAGLSATTGIAIAALTDYCAGNGHGPARSQEYQLNDWSGRTYIAQNTAMGVYFWDGASASYHPYN